MRGKHMSQFNIGSTQIDVHKIVSGLILVLLGVGSIGALTAQSALTAQAETLTDGPGTEQQSLTFAATITAVGQAGRGSTTLAVPAGLTPVLLTGHVTGSPTGIGMVTVAVGSVQETLSLRTGGDVSLALRPDMLTSAETADSGITVTLTNHIDSKPGVTCSYDITSSATLSAITLLATGQERSPTTVAGFFTPSVTSITVVSADSSNPLVNEAVLAAVGSLSSRFDRDTTITATTQAGFVPRMEGGARTVLITADSQSTVHVDVTGQTPPTLTLSGPAKDLAAAAAALGSRSLSLAGSNAVTDLIQKGTAATQLSVSLADLGAAQPVLAGIGRMTYSTLLSQSRFGGPMKSYTVHLEGGNTPTPTGGVVTATVLWNDQIVDSQIVAATDRYVVDLTINSSLVKRDNTLTVRLDVVPAGGYCTSSPMPAELDINGTASTITGHPGQSLNAGFERFPQTMGTRLPIAFGTTAVTPAMLTEAAHLVSALQRASVPQLKLTLVDFAVFAKASYPGVVVGATPADADALAAPLRFAPWRAVDNSGTSFSVTVTGPFAALEAFTTGGRDLLMLGSSDETSASAALEMRLATRADADPYGFFVLNSDLLVAQSGQPELALSTPSLVPQSQVTADFSIPLWIYIAGGVLLLIVIFRLIALRQRKRLIESRSRHGGLSGGTPHGQSGRAS